MEPGYRTYKGIVAAFVCLGLFLAGDIAGAEQPAADAARSSEKPAYLTHGPILGRPGSHRIGVWARSNHPGRMRVWYGIDENDLDQSSDLVETLLAADNTAWVLLSGLRPNTLYYYAVAFDGEKNIRPQGSFKTLPDAAEVAGANNPDGWFNFRFAATSCAKQVPGDPLNLVPYRTMLREHAEKVDFTMQLGDWSYEMDRDWPVSKWQSDAVPDGSTVPAIVARAPNIVGVWQNYKSYLELNPYMAKWHSVVPSYFIFDDHEVLNNFTDADAVGTRARSSLFRDPGLQGWMDYLAWSNPRGADDRIVFGRTNLAPGNDILFDPDADFEKLDLGNEPTLHVHWGGPLAGVRFAGENRIEMENRVQQEGPPDPNAGVYEIVEVVDKHRLRIFPTPTSQSSSDYSIGTRHYYNFRLSNAEFFVLDTRSHRKMADEKRQQDPVLLGKTQMAWLKNAMQTSTARILFVVSPVSFSLPHLDSVTPPVNDSSWTGFPDDRDELLELWETLNRTVIIISGDMHNSYSIRWNDRLWEFGAGPIGSTNRENSAKTGWRPANGEFDSAGRKVNIRWSTYFKQGTPRDRRRAPVYAVIQVNNVHNNRPQVEGGADAYPAPQVVVQFIDALSGDMVYAESVVIAAH